MPSALEIYYSKKETPETVKKMAVKEFLGMDIPRKNIGWFHKLMDILDRPGNATRALLVGKLGGLKGLIPFAQSIENLTGIDIALNKEELVTGVEVIEQFFGRMKQRKGKFDPVDVLGFIVEVGADPIWLTGIGGLTKLGKAAKLSESAIKAAKATGGLDTVRKLIKAAKTGKVVADGGKLAKAFRTVYQAGGKPKLAKTWAAQAAKGQRALLKFAGKPLIKGEKALAGLEKAGIALKKGKVGKLFLAPTRRVPTKYRELHDIYTHFGRDLPFIERQKYFDKIKGLFDKGAKTGLSAEDMDKLVRGYVQRAYAGRGGARLISKIKAKKKMKPAHKVKLAKKVEAKIVQRGREAKELLAGLPPEQAKMTKSLGAEYEKLGRELIEKELKKGVPAKQIMQPLGYARRDITPEFAKFLEANKHRPVFASFARDLSTRNPAQRMRNKILGKMTDEEALKYFQKLGFGGKSVFEPGMAASTFARAGMSTKSIGAADTITEALKKFSKPAGIRTQDVDDYWRMTRGYTATTDEIIEKAGLTDIPEIANLRGRVVPQDIASALLETHNLATSEDALMGFWKSWTGVQRYMKGAFTMPWPAYHSRNMFSNFVLNWIGDVKNPNSYLQALQLQLGKGQPLRLASGAVLSPDDVLRNAREWGILGRSIGMMAPEEIGTKRFVGKMGVVKKHFAGQGGIRQAGQKLGIGIEDNARLAHFIEKLQKGFDFQDAARSAKKVLFDYGDLSAFEKKFLRDRWVFFYTFARKNLPLQVETLMKQPGKQALWSHVMGGTPAIAGREAEYPDWWREQIVSRPIQFPGVSMKEGEEMRIAGMGMPLEEALGSFAGPGYGYWDRLSRVARRQVGKLAPPITTGIEYVTGKDLFYGKDIADIGYAPPFTKYAPRPVKRLMGVRKVEREGKPPYYTMNPQLSWAIRKSPAARAWSSAAMATKRGQPWPITATHFTFGQKPRVLDTEKQKQFAGKRAATDLLKQYYRQGKVKKFQRFYIPKGQQKNKEMDLLLKSQR